jgi:N6-adenosine-specific RNA methylase IME4
MAWEGLSPPYATVVADPPWPYEGDMPINRGSRAGQTMRFLSYSSMTVGEIKALPVSDLAMPGAHLYLWTTNRYLWAAREVAEAWGFDGRPGRVHVLTWCKEPVGHGLGGPFVNTTEFILFCRDRRRAGGMIRRAREEAGLGRAELHRLVRGGDPTGIVYRWEADDCYPNAEDWRRLRDVLPALGDLPDMAGDPSSQPSSWWQWKRGPHSAKPPASLDLVEQVSPPPRVELFARQPRLGWDSWGWGYEQAAG